MISLSDVKKKLAGKVDKDKVSHFVDQMLEANVYAVNAGDIKRVLGYNCVISDSGNVTSLKRSAPTYVPSSGKKVKTPSTPNLSDDDDDEDGVEDDEDWMDKSAKLLENEVNINSQIVKKFEGVSKAIAAATSDNTTASTSLPAKARKDLLKLLDSLEKVNVDLFSAAGRVVGHAQDVSKSILKLEVIVQKVVKQLEGIDKCL